MVSLLEEVIHILSKTEGDVQAQARELIEYLNLRPIKNDEEHFVALREVERLWESESGTPEGDRFETLSILIDEYEKKTFPM